jgi:hemolysin III
MYNGEKLNSITHLVGAILALVGFGALMTIGIKPQNTPLLVGFVIFGFTLVL